MSAEEVKKVMAVQWEEKEPYCMPHGYQYKLENVDNYLKEMDELLLEAGMEGLGYQSQAENIQKTALGMGLLNAYISTLMSEIDAQIDQPLYRGFQNEATEQLSRIRMEDYSTENTLGLKRHYKIHDAYGQIMEYDAQAVSLTMKDFLGLTSLNDNAGHGDLIGMPKEFSDFTNLFAVEYDKIKDNLKDETGKEVTLEEYLTYLNTKGEFDNKMDKPLQELISAILDVTIIKPLIEMCTGYDMITGEDLTDFERGLKGVFAVVDVVTLFIGIKASGVAKLFSREALETGGRIIATDLISNGTAYAVGKMGEELGLPLPITLMLSLGAGVTVALTAGKYVFKDSAGNVVLEAGADEVDGIRTQIKRQAQNGSDALEGGIYSGDLMSAEEATQYSKHWRELGIGSDKTWKEVMNANPNGTIDDYFEIVQKQRPWPLGETGTPTTLKAGNRFFMAVDNDAPENVIGGFGVKERIESTDFVRNNLAVKYDWKTSCNVIREFEVNSGVELKVNAGPVGPQIDLRADIYLPGSTTITQYDLFSNLGSGIKREDYVHIVDEYWID